MVLLAFILTGVCVWLEWQLVHANGPIGDLLRWFYQSKTRSLIGSIGLSVAVGALFGAAGLICFVAGLLSTFIIQPMYAAERSGKIDQVRTVWANHKDINVTRAAQAYRVGHKVVHYALMPLRGVWWTLDRLDRWAS